MRLFWQNLQAYWCPLIGTFVQQPAALATNLKRDTFRHFGSKAIPQSSKI